MLLKGKSADQGKRLRMVIEAEKTNVFFILNQVFKKTDLFIVFF